MKYVIVLGDGMADLPIEQLGQKTPLAFAKTEYLDILSARSEIGMVHTIPDGMAPGSDTANLSVIGYDPKCYYSGRSPLEALSIGVPMKDTDIALRCNIVTISEEEGIPFEKQTIIDHSSGEISTEDCAVLLDAVKKELQNQTYMFYRGTSYRHCLIWDRGKVVKLTPPHDVLGQVIEPYLPKDPMLYEMMKKSFEILKHHPLNEERKRKGLRPANCCWFWGAGTKPLLSDFEGEYQKKGVMISAVDLLKGIAVGAGMDNIEVEGANGGLHTNYEGKARAAVKALTEAIENIDTRVIKTLMDGFERAGTDYRMLVLPDHPTPICIRTHTGDDVPYLLYDSTCPVENNCLYNEEAAAKTGIRVEKGHELIRKLFAR